MSTPDKGRPRAIADCEFDEPENALRRIAARVLVILAAAAAVWGIYRLTTADGGRDAFHKALAEAEARGLPLTFREYEATLAPISAEEDASPYYLAAFDALSLPNGNVSPMVEKINKNLKVFLGKTLPPTPDEWGKMNLEKSFADFVAERREVFDLIREGSGRGRCRYPQIYAGRATYLPYVSQVRTLVWWEILAAWADAYGGRADEAVRRARDASALADSLEEDISFSGVMVACGCQRLALEGALQMILANSSPGNDSLLSIQRLLERHAERLSPDGFLKGEVMATVDLYERSNRPSDDFVESLYAESGRSLSKGDFKKMGRRLGYRLADELRVNVALYDATRAISPEMLQRQGADFVTWKAEGEPFPPIGKYADTRFDAVVTIEKTRARLRCAAAALAACRFRNDNGRWPETLDELVGKYIDELPIDPFTGEPLLLRLTDNSLVIYTVGANGRDDNGYGNLLPEDMSAPGYDPNDPPDDSGFELVLPTETNDDAP